MNSAARPRLIIKRAETLAAHIATHASADALRCALETIDKLANASCDARVFHVAAQVRGLIDSLCESERGEDLPAPKTVRSAQS